MSQSELARRVGISQASIYHLVSGGGQGSKHLHRIARELDTTVAYLEGEIDDPAADAPAFVPAIVDDADDLEMVGIAQADLSYGLGAQFITEPTEIQVLRFPRLWVEAITPSPPALLTWARGRGDSMAPTINDGDIVLLDRSQRQVTEQDALWAYNVGEIGAIKRLRIKGNRVVIQSDNPAVSDDVEPIEDVHIVARVIFVGKRI